jgi:hypothetical protein
VPGEGPWLAFQYLALLTRSHVAPGFSLAASLRNRHGGTFSRDQARQSLPRYFLIKNCRSEERLYTCSARSTITIDSFLTRKENSLAH